MTAATEGTAAVSARNGMFLPGLIAPAASRKSPGVGFAVGGYDGATQSPVMKAAADLRLFGPVDLRIGLRYAPGLQQQRQMQPQVGMRVRALSQARDGIDLSFALLYRMDRFTQDEGMIQGVIALGRRWGRLSTFGNVNYGQDPEGDDRDATIALALLYEAQAAIQVGVESHARFSLFSSDPRRSTRGEQDLQWMVGPMLQYSVGPAAVLAQLGVSGVRGASSNVGLQGLGGLAFAY